jgi:diguanylate cyclase (GGDEF)-like protein
MVLSKGFLKTSVSTTKPDHLSSGLPTLLLVDDEPEIIASLADMYRRSYNVLTASSADEALSVLKKQTVSVIVADQRMPGKTGSELLAEALKIDPDAVRILLTGYADIEAVIQAVNQGKVYFYLTKPWRIDEMDTVITRAIEHNRLLKANRHLVEELRLSNAELEQRVTERTAELEQRAKELEEANRKISELAYLDPLTGVANRRSLEKIFAREVERGVRLGLPITAAMFDIDHFKSVNDTFGHAMGDRVLQFIAQTVSAQARPYDLVARYGGEEFLILMPGISLEQGKTAAERFRASIQAIRIADFPKSVTASFGVACLLPGQPPELLFDRADRALYQAKQNGRNRVKLDIEF